MKWSHDHMSTACHNYTLSYCTQREYSFDFSTIIHTNYSIAQTQNDVSVQSSAFRGAGSNIRSTRLPLRHITSGYVDNDPVPPFTVLWLFPAWRIRIWFLIDVRVKKMTNLTTCTTSIDCFPTGRKGGVGGLTCHDYGVEGTILGSPRHSRSILYL